MKKRHQRSRQARLHPGDVAPRSGQYVEIGPRGRRGREVTVARGETLPPTTHKRATYVLVDPTNNKAGRKRGAA